MAWGAEAGGESDTAAESLGKEGADVEFLYFDQDIVACVKPVGTSSEDVGGGMPELLRKVLGGEIFAVHRLDLNVGGVMVFARNQRAAAAISKQIQDGSMTKEYLAVISGSPEQPCGIMKDLLWKDSKKNKVYVVDRQRKGVKTAKLAYKTLRAGAFSLLQIRLFTGRSHQIRVQFSSRGMPLVGDHKYGSHAERKSPALWSFRLTLLHPADGRRLCFFKLPEGDAWDDYLADMPMKEETESYGVSGISELE